MTPRTSAVSKRLSAKNTGNHGLVLLGKSTGNPWDFPYEIWCFPVSFPLNQSIEHHNQVQCVLIVGGFHSHGGTPIAGGFIREIPIKMDDLGVSPISGNPHMHHSAKRHRCSWLLYWCTFQHSIPSMKHRSSQPGSSTWAETSKNCREKRSELNKLSLLLCRSNTPKKKKPRWM